MTPIAIAIDTDDLEYECACCCSMHDRRDSPPVEVTLISGKPAKVCKECSHSNVVIPRCLQCGGILVRRKFVDSWQLHGEEEIPQEVNEDFYCSRCDLRWLGESSHTLHTGEGRPVEMRER